MDVRRRPSAWPQGHSTHPRQERALTLRGLRAPAGASPSGHWRARRPPECPGRARVAGAPGTLLPPSAPRHPSALAGWVTGWARAALPGFPGTPARASWRGTGGVDAPLQAHGPFWAPEARLADARELPAGQWVGIDPVRCAEQCGLEPEFPGSAPPTLAWDGGSPTCLCAPQAALLRKAPAAKGMSSRAGLP